MLKTGRQYARPARLMMILPHLGIGGAQRVATTLANHWADRGLHIHLVTTLDHKEEFYELNPRITRHVLRKIGVLSRMFAAADACLEEHLASRPVTRDVADSSATLDGEPFSVQSTRYLGSIPPRLATRAKRLNQVFRLALQTGDVWLPFALFTRLAIGMVRQTLFGILCHCIKKRAFGRDPKPYLNLLHASLWRVSALRKLIRSVEPDAVLSFLGATNITTIASAKGLPVRVVISERNDPGRQKLDEPWQSLRPIAYPAADVITANSQGAIDQMQEFCAAPKLAYVPNPVVIPAYSNGSRMNAVLFLARLVYQKAPDVLIDAFAKFIQWNPNWSLQIAGDGPMGRELVQRVHDHGIGDSVIFHGLVKDPTELLARSRVFVLPSRFEGTPNSLLEAMAARLACVVTDASPGPLRLVEHGVSGLVVKTDDIDGLAAALHQLARDAALRRALAQAAWERTRSFGLEHVAHDWERLLFRPEVLASATQEKATESRPVERPGKVGILPGTGLHAQQRRTRA
jgi:glycosyltransferase involved in cell wall biosynthesis